MKINYSRLISFIIAVLYLVAAAFDNIGTFLKVLIFLVLPMTCIWFGDEMGRYTGTFRLQSITSQTPGCFVRFMGWVLLLFPLIIGILYAIGIF